MQNYESFAHTSLNINMKGAYWITN